MTKLMYKLGSWLYSGLKGRYAPDIPEDLQKSFDFNGRGIDLRYMRACGYVLSAEQVNRIIYIMPDDLEHDPARRVFLKNMLVSLGLMDSEKDGVLASNKLVWLGGDLPQYLSDLELEKHFRDTEAVRQIRNALKLSYDATVSDMVSAIKNEKPLIEQMVGAGEDVA